MAITFVAAGTAAAANNANVTPTLPAGIVAGDLLIAVCCWRGDTTTSGTPGGWTNISGSPFTPVGFSQIRIVTLTATGSDTDPTFTYSGIPGQTVIAQVCAFRGSALTVDVVGTVSTNVATANIGPISAISPSSNPTILVVATKQDDWTSVDTLSGDSLTWNEIGEPSSTLGSDAGLVWDYAIATGTPSLTSKTFTVNGGTAQTGTGVMFSIVEPDTTPYLLVKN